MALITNVEKFLPKHGRPIGKDPRALCNQKEVTEFIRSKIAIGWNATEIYQGLQELEVEYVKKLTLGNVRKIIQRMKDKG